MDILSNAVIHGGVEKPKSVGIHRGSPTMKVTIA